MKSPEKINYPITASMLYDYIHCPHRVYLDLYGDSQEKDRVNPFVQLLWERGTLYETEVISGVEETFTDLSKLPDQEREQATLEALQQGDHLIYGGRLRHGDLLGIPDILRKEEEGYIAGDIKSGAGLEGVSDLENGKPKKHYAVQLALYTDLLEQLGVSAGRRAFVWDVHGKEIIYDFTEPQGKRTPETWWEFYEKILRQAREIRNKNAKTQPVCASECKLCQWDSFCKSRVRHSQDLSLIPELGRSKRDTLQPALKNLYHLANADLNIYINRGKTRFHRIGAAQLIKFQERALLLLDTHGRPYATDAIQLPDTDTELFFDIETDPMRDICYLHGFTERRNQDNATEKYHAFFTQEPTPEQEKKAFAQAWKFIRSRFGAALYYYSSYEKTWYRKLQQLYPDVATEEEIDALFDSPLTVDLYTDIVKKKTEWPTHDYSIKTLATYLGFNWRDTEPSGAASIQWYDEWIKTGDPDIRQRILEYNEDDCVATRVVVDGVRKLGKG